MIPKIIIDMCRLSLIAYYDQNKVLSQYNSKNKDELFLKFKDCPKLIEGDLRHDHSIIQNDCQVYSCRYEDSLVFAFRGTESFRDVLSDLNIFRTELKIDEKSMKTKNLVHTGFLKQFNTVKHEIDQDIQYYRKEQSSNNSLIFTGHSLGGALATISSVYYGIKYPDMRVTCITFGSPRVGNNNFVRSFDVIVDESHRYVNEDDPVPMGPTPFRFSHVGGGHWIQDHAMVDKKPIFRSISFVVNFIGSIFGITHDPISDHGCKQYLEEIENFEENKDE